MIQDRFDGAQGFSVDGAIKDAKHIEHLTQDYNSPMPALAAAQAHLVKVRELHEAQKTAGSNKHGVLDASSLVVAARVAAGLDGLDAHKV